jgi:protein-S-isoprenylcysteine O-methyltransferase Ste14
MDGTADASRKPREARADDSQKRNKALGYVRLATVWAAVVALAWFGRPLREEWIAGLVLTALGEGLRIWAAGYLVKTKELITGGPYSYVRNPLYLGRLLILTGVAVAARMPMYLNVVFLVVGYAVFFLYYMPRKERTEPPRLEQIHGEPFRRYFQAVPAIFPRLTPYDDRRGSWKWANFSKNEELLMVVSLTVFFVALAWHGQVF